MDKRDRFEELFRERLHDLECEPDSGQWKTLAGFLPERKLGLFPVSTSRISAIVTLLLLVGGSLLYWQYRPQAIPELSLCSMQPLQIDMCLPEVQVRSILSPSPQDLSLPLPGRKKIPAFAIQDFDNDINTLENNKLPILISSQPLTSDLSVSPILCRHTPKNPDTFPASQRKWHFGMGGGNLNVAGISTGSAGYPEYVYNDYAPRPDDPPLTKSGTATARSLLSELKPEKVKHSCPVSFGISVSRTLSDRWSFNTGLTYSYLRNKWRYEGSGNDVLRQRLHLLGIPASFNYRLADWKRFYCYWSTGINCEFNLTGKIFSAYKSQRQRVRGTLWTANTRIGVAYPVIRYISAYVEGGFFMEPDSGVRNKNRSFRAFFQCNRTNRISVEFLKTTNLIYKKLSLPRVPLVRKSAPIGKSGIKKSLIIVKTTK